MSDSARQLIQAQKWRVSNMDLFTQALTHSSYAHEQGDRHAHNERLEFLGDAVLELIISDYLYHTYPHLPEGKLTRLRSDLVCEASLARLAFRMNLGQYLRLGKGEAAGGGASRPALLADALEALFGALFLDLGFKKCRKYVLALYSPVLRELMNGVLRKDYKTMLQEYTQACLAITPEYRIVEESGPDHAKSFEAEIVINGCIAGRGRGNSKKEAEQAAAREVWEQIANKDQG